MFYNKTKTIINNQKLILQAKTVELKEIKILILNI